VSDRPPIGLLLSWLTPVVIAIVAYRASASVRTYVHALDLRFLTAFQAWRVVGGAFVVMYAYSLLPGVFVYPAGYGDLLVGVMALFALIALIDRKPGWRSTLIGLNVLGLIDFATAFATGMLASPGPLGLLRGDISMAALGQYPLNLIPTFAVPVWTLAHLVAFVQLHRHMRGEHGAVLVAAQG
jgi:hypothetical protein